MIEFFVFIALLFALWVVWGVIEGTFEIIEVICESVRNWIVAKWPWMGREWW